MPSWTGRHFIGSLAAAQQSAFDGSGLRTLDWFGWAVCTLGGLLLLRWLISLRGGDPLTRCPVRRHRLPAWFVPVQLLVWMIGTVLIASVIKAAVPSDRPSLLEAALHGGIILWYLHLAALFLAVAHFGFVRGLKGFGLDFRRIRKDFFIAAATLCALLPLIVLALEGTYQIGRFFFGPDFTMDRHTSLSALQDCPQVWIRLLILVNAVLVVPVFEEILFRGLLQSVLTAALGRPWLSIAVVSILFAAMHPYPTHLSALVILSIGLGYAYEKSGSLWQPIFIHILFNGINVAAVLLGA
ncbi:MAG: type II CAAX endopeptidase family protein [Anaerohalosphaeraceae bacterium]